MPIRQDENQPNRRFGIINLVLIGFGALLLFSSFFPSSNTQVPRVPYSLFINQVDDGEVKRAYITQDQIRYELSTAEEGAPSVLATTPIFDMELPQRLEKKGVEFAAAPPKKPNILGSFLTTKGQLVFLEDFIEPEGILIKSLFTFIKHLELRLSIIKKLSLNLMGQDKNLI